MSFFKMDLYQEQNNEANKKRSLLRAYHNGIASFFKRISQVFSLKTSGSLTVEAAIALPIFLFTVMNLLSIILLFAGYSDKLAEIQQEADGFAIAAHAAEDGQNVENDLIIRTKVIELKPFIPIMGFTPGRTIAQCRQRKWTGYDVTKNNQENKEEEIVYITVFGTAYHYDRSCSHLKLSIHCTGREEIEGMRNEDQERYSACEKCGKKGMSGIIFYTERGNRYHTSLSCSGLSRSIKAVAISKTEGRHACSRCSKRGG